MASLQDNQGLTIDCVRERAKRLLRCNQARIQLLVSQRTYTTR